MAASGRKAKHSNLSRYLKDYTGLLLSVLLILSGFLLFLFSSKDKEISKKDKLQIVTSISPLYSHVKSIVGEYADVVNLIDPGVSPHDYQFSPQDVKSIADADILVINGVGLEEWLEDVIDAAGNENLVIIDSSEGVEIIEGEEYEEGHAHELGNPHIWLSPKIVIRQSINIRDSIADHEKIKNKRTVLTLNHLEYFNRLRKLDQDFEERLRDVKNKNIAVFHSAYTYLSRDYGLSEAVVLEETPGKEPTARELTHSSETIKDLEIKSIFKEPQFSSKVLQTLADELDLEVYELDPIGDTVSADGYLEIMHENLKVLEEALNL